MAAIVFSKAAAGDPRHVALWQQVTGTREVSEKALDALARNMRRSQNSGKYHLSPEACQLVHSVAANVQDDLKVEYPPEWARYNQKIASRLAKTIVDDLTASFIDSRVSPDPTKVPNMLAALALAVKTVWGQAGLQVPPTQVTTMEKQAVTFFMERLRRDRGLLRRGRTQASRLTSSAPTDGSSHQVPGPLPTQLEASPSRLETGSRQGRRPRVV